MMYPNSPIILIIIRTYLIEYLTYHTIIPSIQVLYSSFFHSEYYSNCRYTKSILTGLHLTMKAPHALHMKTIWYLYKFFLLSWNPDTLLGKNTTSHHNKKGIFLLSKKSYDFYNALCNIYHTILLVVNSSYRDYLWCWVAWNSNNLRIIIISCYYYFIKYSTTIIKCNTAFHYLS